MLPRSGAQVFVTASTAQPRKLDTVLQQGLCALKQERGSWNCWVLILLRIFFLSPFEGVLEGCAASLTATIPDGQSEDGNLERENI